MLQRNWSFRDVGIAVQGRVGVSREHTAAGLGRDHVGGCIGEVRGGLEDGKVRTHIEWGCAEVKWALRKTEKNHVIIASLVPMSEILQAPDKRL